MTSAKTMAEVLAEHQQKVGIRDMRSHCWCGWAGEKTGRAFIAHQAAALSAAGYGLVADAKREAWDEGFTACAYEHMAQDRDPSHPITRTSPYRAAEMRQGRDAES